MTISYTLRENDLLDLQLFEHSRSAIFKKRIAINKYSVSIVYIFIGLFLLFKLKHVIHIRIIVSADIHIGYDAGLQAVNPSVYA